MSLLRLIQYLLLITILTNAIKVRIKDHIVETPILVEFETGDDINTLKIQAALQLGHLNYKDTLKEETRLKKLQNINLLNYTGGVITTLDITIVMNRSEEIFFLDTADRKSATVIVYKNGGNNSDWGAKGVSVKLTRSMDPYTFSLFKLEAACQLGLAKKENLLFFRKDVDTLLMFAKDYNLYTRNGFLVKNAGKLYDDDDFYLLKKSSKWFYPAFEVGYRRKVLTDEPELYDVETISVRPSIFRIQNFLTEVEMNDLIEEVKKIPSNKSLIMGSRNSVEYRTSNTTWFPRNGYPQFESLWYKIFNVTKLTKITTEQGIQVVHYEVGQHYYAHVDPIECDEPDTKARFVTFFCYLNDVEEGGETAFPFTGENAWDLNEPTWDPRQCRGLKIKPEKGTCIFWYNLLPENHLRGSCMVDFSSTHMGCDVLKGYKYATNFWINNY